MENQVPTVCSVSRAGQRPIMFLPSKATSLPKGPVLIRANGYELIAHVAKIAINKVTVPDGTTNLLPDLLRGWFGRDAGMPGRKERVTLRHAGHLWIMEPVTPVADSKAA